MTEKSKTIIKEKIFNLPKELQNAINISGWEKMSEEIGKKYLLSEDEINTFQLETASLLLGFIDEDSYPLNIEDSVGVSSEEAKKITGEVNQNIFNPIYETLQKNIKNNLKEKDIKWEKTLEFILSGGDYSVFLERNNDNLSTNTENTETITLDNSSKITDIKNKFINL